jgi:hypothetical protein
VFEPPIERYVLEKLTGIIFENELSETVTASLFDPRDTADPSTLDISFPVI